MMMKSTWKRWSQVQESSLAPRRGLRSCWPGQILHAGRNVGGSRCTLTSRQRLNLLLSLLATITWSDRRGWSFVLAWRNLSSPPASLTLVSPGPPEMKVPPAVPLAILPPNPGPWAARGRTAPWTHPVAPPPSTELVHLHRTRCRCLSWSALCWTAAASRRFLWKTPVLRPHWVCQGALVGVRWSSVLRSASGNRRGWVAPRVWFNTNSRTPPSPNHLPHRLTGIESTRRSVCAPSTCRRWAACQRAEANRGTPWAAVQAPPRPGPAYAASLAWLKVQLTESKTLEHQLDKAALFPQGACLNIGRWRRRWQEARDWRTGIPAGAWTSSAPAIRTNPAAANRKQ